jgi:putative nucleotidyltransferase with HDIG domain
VGEAPGKPSSSQSTTAPERPLANARLDTDAGDSASRSHLPGPRSELAKQIPRRPRVTWWLGAAFAFAFAILVVPAITADRWLGAIVGELEPDAPAPLTVRVPPFAGADTADAHVGGGGIVIARGELPDPGQLDDARAVERAQPPGPVPYIAFAALLLVFGAIFAHHMRRSTLGRLVRVQLVSLVAIALFAWLVKTMLLGTALSVLVAPVALFALIPTMVLDRIVGLATGVLAALVVALLGPFDVGVAILMLVQAATAGLVVAERPKLRWHSVLFAGAVTTLFTAATYVLLTYLTTGAMPAFGEPLHSPWLAAAIGPAIATLVAVPLVPIYQLLVGEITHGKLVALEDLSNPLLRQIAERAPGTWQHSLMMANMAEIAANTIGANGRLVRVGAYYHDLGKSLSPKYFIENLESGETSPHDQLPPEVSCDAIFAHVTEGIVTARKAGLHERIVDFMHMHHGNGVLEYFWGKTREQGNPKGFSIEQFRYPGHPPQSRETAILAICDAVEAASRTLKKPDAASIDMLVQRIVYGKLHLGQLDESGLSMSELRRVSDSLKDTIRHANHGRIEYPWQKAQQDASASNAETGTQPRLDSLDRKPAAGRDSAPRVSERTDKVTSDRGERGRPAESSARAEDVALAETAPRRRTQTRPDDQPMPGKDEVIELVKSASRSSFDEKVPTGELAIIETAPHDSKRDLANQTRRGHDSGEAVRVRRGSGEARGDRASAQDLARASDPSVARSDLRASQASDSGIAADLRGGRASDAPGDPRKRPSDGLDPRAVRPSDSGAPMASGEVQREAKRDAPSASEDIKRAIARTRDPGDGTAPPPFGARPPDGNIGNVQAMFSPPSPFDDVSDTADTPPPLARKRAATLPPTPSRRAPTVPPPMLGVAQPRAIGTQPRTAGPPKPVDLESAVTNPPPLRRGPNASNAPPSTRLPGMILESLDRLGNASQASDDDETRVTAPRAVATPHDDSAPSDRRSGRVRRPSEDAHEIAPMRADTSPPPSMVRGPAAAMPRPRDDDKASGAPRAKTASDSAKPTIPRSADDIQTNPRLGPRFLEDPSRTEPSLPRFEMPASDPAITLPGNGGPNWSAGLAARIDAALDGGDEWSKETPVVAPTKAELRALLGMPDPTRKQSLDELEALHRATTEARDGEDAAGEILKPRNPPSATAEVDPDDIEAAIEVAPRARQRAPSAIAVAKKPKKTD